MSARYWIGGVMLGIAQIGAAQTIDEALVPVDHPAIQYDSAPVNERVTRVIAGMKSGKVNLTSRPDGTGVLESLLHSFGVNPDSQVLVFSKTSFQASRNSPRNPRAIYFSDDMMFGSVRGSDLLEVAALDPKQGFVFYSFDEEARPPRFDRRDVCLQRHESIGTPGVPGIMVASVYPGADGLPAFRGAPKLTDHRSPLNERWGGWYVTGTHGEMLRLGNAIGHEQDHPEVLDVGKATLNLTDLSTRFDPAGYIAPVSDIVALMTLEHQTRMTDLIIRVGWKARVLEHDSKALGGPNEAARAHLESDIESLVTYILFAEEAPLDKAVQGVSTLTKTFTDRGPRGRKGRYLRDFDLKTRLFKYPLSYVVYSEAFDNLPDTVREKIYRRVYDVLAGKDRSPKFKRLSAENRQAIVEILRDTKKGLPEYWSNTVS